MLDKSDEAHGLDDETIRALYPALHRFAAVVAPWDMDPDDVLHDALVRALRTGRREVANPGAYVRTAIVNSVRSQIRHNRSQRRATRLLAGGNRGATTEAYPSDVAELMRLRPLERAVLYLHDIEGYRFEEVAGLLGISSSHARVLATRSRRRLKRELLTEEAK